MVDNEANNKVKYLKLDTLEDIKSLVCDILSECKDSGNMVENSGRICNLLQVWIKCYSLSIEIEKVKDLEARIEALEGGVQ